MDVRLPADPGAAPRPVIGYEALLRLPADAGFVGASEAFAAAAGTDALVDLEIAALETHLRSAREPGERAGCS